MKDKEFGSKKLFKLNYRRGDQINQAFCKIGSAQKLSTSCLIFMNLKTVKKVLLNHAECIQIY